MGRRWLSGLAFSLLTAICGMAQQPGGQVDPWNGGAGYGASGAPPINSSAEVPPESRRADEGAGLIFKSQTTLVEVPVVVVDKAGGHLHGLSKSDFKILEDGKEELIAGFEEVIPASSKLMVTSGAPGTFSNLHLERQQPHSVTVIVLDMVNTPFLDQSYARGQLMKYLSDHLDSTQVLGLMAIGSKGLMVLSGLTTDPAVLISTLKKEAVRHR